MPMCTSADQADAMSAPDLLPAKPACTGTSALCCTAHVFQAAGVLQISTHCSFKHKPLQVRTVAGTALCQIVHGQATKRRTAGSKSSLRLSDLGICRGRPTTQ